jgi:hypothetical protein
MQTTIESNIFGSDPAQMVLTHSFRTRYGKEFDEINGPDLVPSIRIPTLVTCGTKDFNTPCTPGGPVGSGVSALAASFAPGVAQFVAVPNMVHIFRDVGADDPTQLADQVKVPLLPGLRGRVRRVRRVVRGVCSGARDGDAHVHRLTTRRGTPRDTPRDR